MGGQTAAEHALQIDMRKMNRVVALDVKAKKITVEAGARWRDIQEVIDAKDLSLQIMQTYANFTVGGSLSVNAHGRYANQGPLIRSVESIKMVLADGSVAKASPDENAKLFYGAIGGYGARGVIVEATLRLTDNVKVERLTQRIPIAEYRAYFNKQVRGNAAAVFHNEDLYPPTYDDVRAVTWVKTEKLVTVNERLIARNQSYFSQPVLISALSSIPGGLNLRAQTLDPLQYSSPKVEWRNYEASSLLSGLNHSCSTI